MNNFFLIFFQFFVVICWASEQNLSVGFFSVANGKSQEDKFSINSIQQREFFGVYDGHFGSKTAEYLASNLPLLFERYLVTSKIKKEVFELAFRDAEQNALKNNVGGSTALAAYVGKKNMHIAWVGDTRAVVVDGNGEICFVTQDHDLENKAEWDRVRKAQGVIFREITKTGLSGKWRINYLEMTRSIGDKWAKGKDFSTRRNPQPFRRIKEEYSFLQQWPDTILPDQWALKALEGQVIAEPEYAEVPLNEKNRWLILATDGLWNFVKNEEIGTLVKEKAHENNSVGSIATILGKIAIDRGSEDNITVLIIDLWSRKNK